MQSYENKHFHHLKLSWNVFQGLFYSHDKLATLQGGQPWKKCLAEMWSKDKPQEQVWDIFQDIRDADAKTNHKKGL